jgi:predicted DNA-binding WGR domain protein
MTLEIDIQLLKHVGGTKFYEAAVYTKEDQSALLVYRWGPIGSLDNGRGQTAIVECDNKGIARLSRETKVAEKVLRGYVSAGGTPGFGHHHHNVDDEENAAFVLKRYRSNDTAKRILNWRNGDVAPVEPGEWVLEAPKSVPSIVRDKTWGSW